MTGGLKIHQKVLLEMKCLIIRGRPLIYWQDFQQNPLKIFPRRLKLYIMDQEKIRIYIKINLN
ncbi:MAG: hypothetical protein CBD03_01085 [Rhizobiales bacterium TMED143]|nr:MAG: hypothetical protein CBD03_01085 [Rhizobiales bacterium TMED143]